MANRSLAITGDLVAQVESEVTSEVGRELDTMYTAQESMFQLISEPAWQTSDGFQESINEQAFEFNSAERNVSHYVRVSTAERRAILRKYQSRLFDVDVSSGSIRSNRQSRDRRSIPWHGS